jgi:hypothetical protein
MSGSKSSLGILRYSIVLDRVDYDRKPEEGLAQADLYAVDRALNATNLPSLRCGTERAVRLDFIELPRIVGWSSINRALKDFGDPAGAAEMVATALEHPLLQHQEEGFAFPGASWGGRFGYRFVGYLDADAGSRYAGVLWDRQELLYISNCVWGVIPRT